MTLWKPSAITLPRWLLCAAWGIAWLHSPLLGIRPDWVMMLVAFPVLGLPAFGWQMAEWFRTYGFRDGAFRPQAIGGYLFLLLIIAPAIMWLALHTFILAVLLVAFPFGLAGAAYDLLTPSLRAGG